MDCSNLSYLSPSFHTQKSQSNFHMFPALTISDWDTTAAHCRAFCPMLPGHRSLRWPKMGADLCIIQNWKKKMCRKETSPWSLVPNKVKQTENKLQLLKIKRKIRIIIKSSYRTNSPGSDCANNICRGNFFSPSHLTPYFVFLLKWSFLIWTQIIPS